MKTPIYIECPYCHEKFEENCEYVDIGVGMQQCSPNYCPKCGACEIGMSGNGTPEERLVGWTRGIDAKEVR